ncbi:hypothetical protein GJ654_19500 [Rhodoblastus acidophilus]|uniref:1,3-beta-glucanase n=1 Tax=Rhodoblastus acidophilus TaxID=1074 RepID=A0A6N8DRH5_RHOAC|nr:hypothetical protein [Rhodoblastus acidophilus]MCW2276081.1 hypothetical protein [Rhodoblastus acidophilus]MTV33170.1 hypothetical protein [Rhodoblastus acidophilus]
MRKRFLAVSAAGLCALAAIAAANAQTPPPRHGKIQLPANVMTSDDWLDDGNVVPEGYGENYVRAVEAPADVQVGADLDQNW